MSVTDLFARRTQAFAARFLAACDQAARGGKLLHTWKAFDTVDFIEQHEAEDFADARHGLEQREGMGIVPFGSFQDGEFEVFEQLIVIGNERYRFSPNYLQS